MDIREEQADEKAAIFAVHAAAFPSDAEARLVDKLRADGDLVLSRVAHADGHVVGHVAFSRIAAPFRALGLAPLGVLPQLQGRGIGSALIRDGVARARASGWDGIFVLGDVAYYERFGFRVALASGFSCQFAGPHFMVLPLGAALPASSGDVAYAPAFDTLD